VAGSQRSGVNLTYRGKYTAQASAERDGYDLRSKLLLACHCLAIVSNKYAPQFQLVLPFAQLWGQCPETTISLLHRLPSLSQSDRRYTPKASRSSFLSEGGDISCASIWNLWGDFKIQAAAISHFIGFLFGFAVSIWRA
jgi:hypothetical protein